MKLFHFIFKLKKEATTIIKNFNETFLIIDFPLFLNKDRPHFLLAASMAAIFSRRVV